MKRSKKKILARSARSKPSQISDGPPSFAALLKLPPKKLKKFPLKVQMEVARAKRLGFQANSNGGMVDPLSKAATKNQKGRAAIRRLEKQHNKELRDKLKAERKAKKDEEREQKKLEREKLRAERQSQKVKFIFRPVPAKEASKYNGSAFAFDAPIPADVFKLVEHPLQEYIALREFDATLQYKDPTLIVISSNHKAVNWIGQFCLGYLVRDESFSLSSKSSKKK